MRVFLLAERAGRLSTASAIAEAEVSAAALACGDRRVELAPMKLFPHGCWRSLGVV